MTVYNSYCDNSFYIKINAIKKKAGDEKIKLVL